VGNSNGAATNTLRATTNYTNHYTTFTNGQKNLTEPIKSGTDVVRISDIMAGSQELNKTETIPTSDIRQIKLNYLQLNKRSSQQDKNKQAEDAKKNLVSNERLEKPVARHLEETLKTVKVQVNSAEERHKTDDLTTPAQAYDRNQEKAQTAKTGKEEDDIEFCTPNSTYENLDNYIIGKRLGQGAYAVVRLGLHKELNQKIAVKIYEKLKLIEPNRRKSVKREMKIMEKLDH
jgi:hypothetical protein